MEKASALSISLRCDYFDITGTFEPLAFDEIHDEMSTSDTSGFFYGCSR
jgi:hypothetical protein